MQTQITNWESFEDLIQQIKSYSAISSQEIPLEIERKWLVNDNLIDYLKLNYQVKSHYEVVIGYLSVNPEIRYHSKRLITDEPEVTNWLTYKTDGDLTREEYMVEVTMSTALKMAKIIREDKKIKPFKGSKFITKDYWVFDIGDGKELEISVVDSPMKFIYLEIEFPDVDSASSYHFPDDIDRFIEKEVTNDPYYKMKKYWSRTRLKK